MIAVEGRSAADARALGRGLGVTSVLLYCSLAVAAFVFVVSPALRGELSVTAWADTLIYYEYAREHLGWQLLTLSGNYVGPVALILALQYDDTLILVFNCLLLLATYLLVVRVYDVREASFALLLLANPMTFASLLTVNKEILGLAGILAFACFLVRRSPMLLAAALLLSAMARWHQVLAILAFWFFTSRLWPLRRHPAWTIAAVLAVISVGYSLIPSDLLASLGSTPLTAIQEEKAGGLLGALNGLQRNFGYAIVAFPKIGLNWFGNLGRVWDLVEPGPDFDPTMLYNYAVIGHQLSMVVVTGYLVSTSRFRLTRPLIFLAVLYSVLFSLSLIIQYRYFYPVFGLFALEASRRRVSAAEPAPGAGDS